MTFRRLTYLPRAGFWPGLVGGAACAVLSLPIGVPAFAQDEAARIRVSRGDCAEMTRHLPAPDVTYRAGIDTAGRPVAPADLGGGAGRLDIDPDTISIPITRPLRQFFGVPGDRAAFETRGARIAPFAAEADIGVVTLHEGRAYFNGQPLADPAAHAIAEACRRQQSER